MAVTACGIFNNFVCEMSLGVCEYSVVLLMIKISLL